MKKKNNKTSLIAHFSEFRKRLLRCLVFFLVSFLIAYNFAELAFSFLSAPLGETKMIYTGLTEGFFTYLKVAYFVALFLSIPYCLLEFWGFIAPGLYEVEKKSILPFLILTPFLFYLGGAFVYFLVMPNAWQFFLSFQSESIELSAKISEYLSLVMSLIIAFGICFELPILLSLLVKFKVVSYEKLKKFRRYFIVLAFVCGAFMTPPDIVSQLFLATAIIVLFELSLLMIRFLKK